MARLAISGSTPLGAEDFIGPPRPVDVRILIVTDEYGHFERSTGTGVGMGHLLDVLSSPPGPWARFVVTTANRRTDRTANLQNFRFNAGDANLQQYDQIWLLGIERYNNPQSELRERAALPPAELAALAEFQDAGGGVFATGDHEDLGANLSGEVLRVRSMRRWYIRRQSPDGYPDAPPANAIELANLSHDTRAAPRYDEFDSGAQTIRPTYWRSPRPAPEGYFEFPHPILCGPRGPITHLPDHVHEGSCDLLGNFDRSYEWEGATFEEYPGAQRPMVVAWSDNNLARYTRDPQATRTFPAIAAYDGHPVGVGRVATDSTWHHFANPNLEGFLNTSPGSPEHGHWQEIQAYFRNLAVWLVGPTKQRAMAARALWRTRWHGNVIITVDPRVPIDLPYVHRLGEVAMDVLGRVATHCEALVFAKHVGEASGLLPFPWDSDHDKALIPPQYVDLVRTAAMGGAFHSLSERFPSPTDEYPEDDDEVLKVMSKGLQLGVPAVVQHLEDLAGSLPPLIEKLKTAVTQPENTESA